MARPGVGQSGVLGMGGAGLQRDPGPSAYIEAGWLMLVLSLTGRFGRLLVSVPRPILAAVLASL